MSKNSGKILARRHKGHVSVTEQKVGFINDTRMYFIKIKIPWVIVLFRD